MNNYHIYEQEAKGKYSVIFKARKKKRLEFVAIKRLQKTRKAKVYNEAKILSQLNHQNIIKFYDFMQTKNHMWEITEYCPGGDLLKIIEYDKQLPEHTVRSFILQIMAGMQYAHSKGIIICDIKPASVLVNQYGSVKIGDFGSAQKLVDMMGKAKTKKKGTPSYMAPQLFDVNGVYSFQSDLWAIGCMMYELAQGNPPFVSTNFQQIAQLSKSAPTPKVDNFSSDFNNLLCRLLQKDPMQRITWRQIITHPWIKHELQELQIPEQTHFLEYIRQRASIKTEQLRVSHNFENQNYGNATRKITASDRRELFEFQNYEQEYEEECFQQQKDKMEEEELGNVQVNMKKNKGGSNTKNQQIPNNRKIGPKGNTQKQPNPIGDSSTINTFLQTLTSKPTMPLEQAISHQSDTAVKPIIGNKDIEVIESVNFNKNQLGFSYIQPEILAEGIVNHEMDEQLKKILEGMKGQEKTNVLGYFETIVQNSEVANELFKTNYIPYYMSLLRGYKQSNFRAKICEILGLLIRHATSIDSEILKYGIITGFVQTVTKDKSEKVRRKAMAALGELLFYGATQVDQDANEWDIPLSLISTLLKILKNTNQDEIVRVYCCKSIENITAQAQKVGLNFSQIDTLLVMLNSFTSTRNQGFRSSIMATIHHMICLNPTLRQIFLQKMPLNLLIESFQDPEVSSKTVQILLWIILQQFSKNPKSKHTRTLIESKELIRSVLGLMDNSNSGSVIKGRVYLFIYFFLSSEFRKIFYISESKIFHAIERHGKQTGKYESQALQFVVAILYENFPAILKLCSEQLQVFLTSSTNISKNNTILIISQMQSCQIFQQLFNVEDNIQFLINFFNLLQTKSKDQLPYMQHFKNHFFMILEKIFTNDSTTEKMQQFYCTNVVPFLIGKLLKTTYHDIRYSCIKYLIFIINFCLSEEFLYDSTILTDTSSRISSLITTHLIPQLDILFDEGEIVVNMIFKLMAQIFKNRATFISKFWDSCKVEKLLPYLGQNSTINILKTVQHLFSCKMSAIKENIVNQFWTKTIELLIFYRNSGQQLFLEYPLTILRNIVLNHPIIKLQKSEIDAIFSNLIILQSHEDSVVRSNAEQLVEVLLANKIYSEKGLQDWKCLSKKGLQNYENFVKLSGLKANIKPTEAKQLRAQKESRYHN